MKFSYDIFPDRRTIVARYVGAFTIGELIASAQLIWADPRYSRMFGGLADVSAASMGVAMSDFRSMVDFFHRHDRTSQAPWAVVASTPLATAYGIVYQRAMGARHPLEIFSTWEAACEFLGVDLPPNVALISRGVSPGSN